MYLEDKTQNKDSSGFNMQHLLELLRAVHARRTLHDWGATQVGGTAVLGFHQ